MILWTSGMSLDCAIRFPECIAKGLSLELLGPGRRRSCVAVPAFQGARAVLEIVVACAGAVRGSKVPALMRIRLVALAIPMAVVVFSDPGIILLDSSVDPHVGSHACDCRRSGPFDCVYVSGSEREGRERERAEKKREGEKEDERERAREGGREHKRWRPGRERSVEGRGRD